MWPKSVSYLHVCICELVTSHMAYIAPVFGAGAGRGAFSSNSVRLSRLGAAVFRLRVGSPKSGVAHLSVCRDLKRALILSPRTSH